MHQITEFNCPHCGSNKHKTHGLPELIYLNWVINPGAAIVEVFAGMCVPQKIFECLNCDKPLIERSYICCPHCDTAHDSRVWGKSNGLGHWLGLVCPHCGGQIPRLWNIFSLLALMLTAPLWWIPVRIGRKRWLAWERKRAQNAQSQSPEFPLSSRTITKMSLSFGLGMWIFTTLQDYWNGRADLVLAIVMLPVWIIGGFIFTYGMNWWANQRPRKH